MELKSFAIEVWCSLMTLRPTEIFSWLQPGIDWRIRRVYFGTQLCVHCWAIRLFLENGDQITVYLVFCFIAASVVGITLIVFGFLFIRYPGCIFKVHDFKVILVIKDGPTLEPLSASIWKFLFGSSFKEIPCPFYHSYRKKPYQLLV